MYLRPGVRFSKAPKLFGSISGTLIHYDFCILKTKMFLSTKLYYAFNISHLKDMLK